MTQSLRTRLLIGVIGLVVIGLLISDIVTYATLQNFLLDRIDQQLMQNYRTAVGVLGGPDEGPGAAPATQFPIGTVFAVVAPDGSVLTQKMVVFGLGPAPRTSLVLPHSLPNLGMDKPSVPFTVAASGAAANYRMIDWPEDSFQGNFVVLAIPMTDVQTTLSHLVELEAKISLAVVAATVILALLIIWLSLRPLRRMGAVAADIAAGDLTRRVEPATTKTEIGRLGLALNGMLNQIEAAFAERTESNLRLRRFVADASHELRTPLTSIRGYSEMLRRGASKSPTDSELARRRIEEESIRMTGLVDDMLVLARLDQGRPFYLRGSPLIL